MSEHVRPASELSLAMDLARSRADEALRISRETQEMVDKVTLDIRAELKASLDKIRVWGKGVQLTMRETESKMSTLSERLDAAANVVSEIKKRIDEVESGHGQTV